jgi:hypothetical protein
VSDNRITSIINWQNTWIGPLFLQARHPRFVDYNGEFMLMLPENYAAFEDEDEKLRVRTQIEKSIVLWTQN